MASKESSPKKPKATPKAAPAQKFIDGLKGVSDVVEVPLTEIDLKHEPYQFRFKANPGDLIASLETHGQQDPVVLQGKNPPYKIVDGHRRIKAFGKLGWDKIKAIVRDLSADEASNISFIRNVKRKNLSLMEKAKVINDYSGKKNKTAAEIASLLGYSERQVKRFLELVRFPKPIKDAVEADLIGMSHAKMLSKLPLTDTQDLLKQLKNGSINLREMVKKAEQHKPSLKIFGEDTDGFRFYPFRYDKGKTSADQKKNMIDGLKKALAILEKK